MVNPDPIRLNHHVMANFRALVGTAYNFRGSRGDRTENCAPEVLGSTAMFVAFIAHSLSVGPGEPVDREKAKEMIAVIRDASETALEAIDNMIQRQGKIDG
jgi:hypothetical protein